MASLCVPHDRRCKIRRKWRFNFQHRVFGKAVKNSCTHTISSLEPRPYHKTPSELYLSRLLLEQGYHQKARILQRQWSIRCGCSLLTFFVHLFSCSSFSYWLDRFNSNFICTDYGTAYTSMSGSHLPGHCYTPHAVVPTYLKIFGRDLVHFYYCCMVYWSSTNSCSLMYIYVYHMGSL